MPRKGWANMRSSRPKELSELRHILGRGDTDVRLLAGGTDLVVHLNRNPQEKWHLVDLTGIEELKKIERKGHCLEIGALVTFQELEESTEISSGIKSLSGVASLVGSCQIRNRGTTGGNVANGSAAADLPPVLCALNALVVIERYDGSRRTVPAGEANPIDMTSLARHGEYIRKFLIPLNENDFSFFSKIGSRRAVTISKINLASSWRRQEGYIVKPRIYLGALGSWPIRASEAEEFLSSAPSYDLSESEFLRILSATVERTIPKRASMPYKRQAVKGLGHQLWRNLGEVIE